MCTNYRPTRREELIESFHVDIRTEHIWPDEVWKDYPAPFIRHENGNRQALVGTYGMVPKWHIPEGVKSFSTMNARTETVGQLRSFSKPWKSQQTCLVPYR